MKKSVFDKGKLLKELFSRRDVRIRAMKSDEKYKDASICLVIGAFVNVSLIFTKVPGVPEWCEAKIGSSSFLYTAGQIDEAEMACDIWEKARARKWGVSRTTDENSPAFVREHMLVFPSTPENFAIDETASHDIHDNEGYPVAELGTWEVPYISHSKYQHVYEDVSWKSSEKASARAIREYIVSILGVWNELFPDFLIVGCDENELRFRYKNSRGYIFVDTSFNDEQILEIDVGLDAGSFGAFGVSLEPFRIPISSSSSQVADWLTERADSFKTSCMSLTENPIVVDKTLTSSTYQIAECPYETRSLYPASVADEVKLALACSGILFPVKLAEKILADEDIGDYNQRHYDKHHDYEIVIDSFSYDAEQAVLFARRTVNDCVNIDELPTFIDVENIEIRGLSLSRLERMVKGGCID